MEYPPGILQCRTFPGDMPLSWMHHGATDRSLLMPHHSVYHLLSLSILLSAGCSDVTVPDAVGLLEWDRVELVAEASEPITAILVQEGERVAADDVILRQDSRRLQAQLDEAIAARAQASARLAELRRGPRVERIDEARARLQGAESEVDTLRHELRRQLSLADKKLASPEATDLARLKLDQAVAAHDMARAQLDELLAGTTAEELQQGDAVLAGGCTGAGLAGQPGAPGSPRPRGRPARYPAVRTR
jgi:HlyD family secretion protein